ncbi:MAG: Npun_F0494 family protein [Microcoleaceae cyanobacterium]
MTSTPPDVANVVAKSTPYLPATLERAERAIRCSPFQLKLFMTMRYDRVELKAITAESGVGLGYTRWQLSELAAENYLLWLIQVGVLRREVDGQGITDSFRLTPLGRQLVDHWEALGQGLAMPTGRDRWLNALTRWLRFPL